MKFSVLDAHQPVQTITADDREAMPVRMIIETPPHMTRDEAIKAINDVVGIAHWIEYIDRRAMAPEGAAPDTDYDLLLR